MKPGLSTAEDDLWVTMFPVSYPSCRLIDGPIQLSYGDDAHSFSPGFSPQFRLWAVVVPAASVIFLIQRSIFDLFLGDGLDCTFFPGCSISEH
jgi:hypothetical protein